MISRMNPKVALIVALSARLELLFEQLPPESKNVKKAVLDYSSYVLDHSKPQAVLAAMKPLKGETAISYLIRHIERINTVPEYRWPKIRGAAEHLPQGVFAPTAAMQEILRGKTLGPRDTLELLSWLEPVWAKYPELKSATQSLFVAKV